VPDLDEGAFAEAVEEASRLCPVSNALTGNVEIAVEATLDGTETKMGSSPDRGERRHEAA
jgi:uncharacterized OsmC-like protein